VVAGAADQRSTATLPRTTSGGLNPSLMRARSHSGKLVKIPFDKQKTGSRRPPLVSSGPTNYSRLRCLVFKEHAPPTSPFPVLVFVSPCGSPESEATQNILSPRPWRVKPKCTVPLADGSRVGRQAEELGIAGGPSGQAAHTS